MLHHFYDGNLSKYPKRLLIIFINETKCLLKKIPLRRVMIAPQTSFHLSFLYFYTGEREPNIDSICFEKR